MNVRIAKCDENNNKKKQMTVSSEHVQREQKRKTETTLPSGLIHDHRF